jgi:hypothetical protein
MSDYAFLTPFFSNSHLCHLRLKNGWVGPEDKSTLTSPQKHKDELESLNIPKEHIPRNTPLKTLELEDCRILPQILGQYESTKSP